MLLVRKGMLKCMVESLKIRQNKILAVSLEGISNVLACGEANFTTNGINLFA